MFETADTPRHPYGPFRELDVSPMAADVDRQVGAWLKSGEDCERYPGMNVCRYDC